MKPRAAAVAFAASALFAAPALAEPGHHGHDHNKVGTSAAVQFDIGNGLAVTLAGGEFGLRSHHGSYGHRRGNRGYRNYGYRDYDLRRDRQRTKQLRRRAINACKQAVKYEGRDRGFRHVHLDDVERVRQIGPNGFRVRAEFEFENRRRDFERDVVCTVRRGKVVDIEGLPRGRGYRNAGYGGRGGRGGYNDYGYRLDTVEFGFGNWNGRKNYRDYNRNDWRSYDNRHNGHNHNRGEYCKIY